MQYTCETYSTNEQNSGDPKLLAKKERQLDPITIANEEIKQNPNQKDSSWGKNP